MEVGEAISSKLRSIFIFILSLASFYHALWILVKPSHGKTQEMTRNGTSRNTDNNTKEDEGLSKEGSTEWSESGNLRTGSWLDHLQSTQSPT